MRALDEAPMIEDFLVIVEREVGERLAAAPGSHVYGSVSVYVAYACEAELVGSVPATVFMPRPKVESVLVRMRRRAQPPVHVDDRARMFVLVPPFHETRRCVGRSLRNGLGGRADAVLAGAGMAPLTRAEMLGLEEWAALRASRRRSLVNGATTDAPAPRSRSRSRVGAPPDGYHELDALVAIVDEPHDELSVIPGAHDSELLVQPPGSAPVDGTNLVGRARAELGSTAGLRLRKQIPAQAGLGGGSADAAATLRLLRTTQSDTELQEIAASLGADVPVCLHGGIVRMRGIGEVLEPIAAPAAPLHLVLATPTFGCSTADVYRAWDELDGPASPRELAPTFGSASWRNDLEPAALRVESRLVAFRDALERLAGPTPILCGSGSTYLVVMPSRHDAERVVERTRSELDTRCVAVATVE